MRRTVTREFSSPFYDAIYLDNQGSITTVSDCETAFHSMGGPFFFVGDDLELWKNTEHDQSQHRPSLPPKKRTLQTIVQPSKGNQKKLHLFASSLQFFDSKRVLACQNEKSCIGSFDAFASIQSL